MGKRTLLLLPLAALAFAPAAGGDVHAAAKTLKIKAKGGGNTAFNKTTLTAPAGKVTIVMKNPRSSFLDHGVAIKRKKGEVVQPGGKSTVSAKLEAGRYTYFCPVAGHRAGGMKGRLTVK
jgi:uncharacterized cupredoxin-like copper-binding protein